MIIVMYVECFPAQRVFLLHSVVTELHFKHVQQFDVWLNLTECSVQQQTGRFCGETPGGKMELIHR